MAEKITLQRRVELIREALGQYPDNREYKNDELKDLLDYIRNISSMPEGWVKATLERQKANG